MPHPNALTDIGYWRALLPGLAIDESRFEATSIFGPDLLSQCSADLSGRGYLHLPPLLPAEEIETLREALMVLRQHQLPPVCIYLYDGPWLLFEQLRGLVAHFLGEDFCLLPNFWAWHLDTDKGARGWPAHRDCQAETRFPDGRGGDILMSLSFWVPLTDADEDNGCMVVLPRECESAYQPPLTDPDQIDPTDGIALPAKAGSVLGWPQDLYHWSSSATGASTTPRLSLSLEFQNASFEPLRAPLLDLANPPDFKTRLALIADQFDRYRHMEESVFDPARLRD